MTRHHTDRIPAHLQAWSEQAHDDLAKRLHLSPDQISLEQAVDVTWPDGAMGCPQPDSYYTQALVPGYRLIFNAGGNRHHYHGQHGKPPFYCPADRAGQPLPDHPESLT